MVFDKTGTLTNGKPAVTGIITFDERWKTDQVKLFDRFQPVIRVLQAHPELGPVDQVQRTAYNMKCAYASTGRGKIHVSYGTRVGQSC